MDADGLKGILAFVHTVEAGSFTAAAGRLRVTKSAVAKSVAEAERRLGVRLFRRTTRSLSVTGEGEAYYRACVRALAEIDAAQAALAAGRQEPAGRLRIDVPLSFGRRCVAPVLFDLATRHPALEIEISFNDRRVDLVEEGFDLAVRLGELDDSAGIAARRLGTQRSVLCAAPAYLDRRGRPATVEELAGHAMIAYGREGVVRSWLVPGADGRPLPFKPAARLVLGHGDPMLDAVRAGQGVSFLPTWLVAEDLKRGALELVLDGEPIETGVFHAIWPAPRTLAPKCRVVVDALVGRFAAPDWEWAAA